MLTVQTARVHCWICSTTLWASTHWSWSTFLTKVGWVTLSNSCLSCIEFTCRWTAQQSVASGSGPSGHVHDVHKGGAIVIDPVILILQSRLTVQQCLLWKWSTTSPRTRRSCCSGTSQSWSLVLTLSLPPAVKHSNLSCMVGQWWQKTLSSLVSPPTNEFEHWLKKVVQRSANLTVPTYTWHAAILRPMDLPAPNVRTLSTTVQALRFIDIHEVSIIGFFDEADQEGNSNSKTVLTTLTAYGCQVLLGLPISYPAPKAILTLALVLSLLHLFTMRKCILWSSVVKLTRVSTRFKISTTPKIVMFKKDEPTVTFQGNSSNLSKLKAWVATNGNILVVSWFNLLHMLTF